LVLKTGNDKVFGAMRAFIQSLRYQGVENPEELLLEDDESREKLTGYIDVSSASILIDSDRQD
jgi:hypothetical protein